MAGNLYLNSFAPMTPIGQGMQNIALAMFGGRSPNERALDESRMANYEANARYHDANAQLTAAKIPGVVAEGELSQRRAGWSTDDGIDETVAFRTGIPLPKVRAIKAHIRDGAELPADVTPADVQRFGQARFSHQGGLSDKTYNPEGVERGIQTGTITTMAQNATPAQLPTVAGTAAAMKGSKFFDSDPNGGVLNLYSGDYRTDNPIARAGIGYKNAQAANQNAQAGEHSARAGQINYETRSGVKIGPPVAVNDAEVGTIYAPPGAAVGRAPAAVPRDHAPARVPQVAAPKPEKPRKVTPNDQKMFGTALTELAMEMQADGLDNATQAAIVRQAEREYQADPTIAHREAVKRAVDAVAPQGFELQGTYGFRKYGPKGGARSVPTPVPVPQVAPTAAPAPAPTPAPARPQQPAARVPTVAPAAPAPAPSPAAAGGLPQPKSEAEYNALPQGSQYIGTDGQVRIKGGA